MNYKNLLSGVIFTLATLTTLQVVAQSPTNNSSEWQLVWQEEFDVDGAPNPEFWSHENGFVRNKEAQWYQSQNSICEGGVLKIEGRKERIKNTKYEEGSDSWRLNRKYAEYSSGSINTRGKYEFLYGRLEVRAKIPAVSGAWPAIWTLGSGMPWPSCGEIDLMEFYQVNGEPTILANVAWGNDRPYNAVWDNSKTPFTHFLEKDPDWASKFHVWRMDWDEESIKLYLDDELLNTTPLSRTVNGSIGDHTNPFKSPQYILLNLAMGENGGEIDESNLPMLYEVDYVRVYQQKR